MIYIRKIYNQDIDDNHQMQIIKEPAYSFFNFPYNPNKKNLEDKYFTIHVEKFFGESGSQSITAQFQSRIYQSTATKNGVVSCEARLGSDLRKYLKKNVLFEVGDIIVFRNKKGKSDVDYNNIYVDYISKKSIVYQAYNAFLNDENHSVVLVSNEDDVANTQLTAPLQLIYYGAPGTGKSYETDEVTSRYPNTIRTTFHPDSDYSTFVGAYKPTTVTKERYVMDGSKSIAMTYPGSTDTIQDTKIEYRFVKQAFLKAYINAWKLFAKADDLSNIEPQFLIIEEINRGNCAQIFGDLFQILDRKNGFSEYPIEADEDICKALLDEDTKENPSFGVSGLKLSAEQKEIINAVYEGKGASPRDVADDICKGKVLVLPCNMYIWATMNTSDQSLFPIDSAFKRRWQWKYVRIKEGKDKQNKPLKYRIKFNVSEDNLVDESWWEFIKKINTKIEEATKSEDKKLGYFFCKPDKKADDADVENTIISAEAFVGKVVFYLWQDVFKDYGFKSDIFKKDGEHRLSFHDFYPDNIEPDASNPEAIDLALVQKFIYKVIYNQYTKPEDKSQSEQTDTESDESQVAQAGE